MALYCQRADVYATGLQPEAFVWPPRAVEGSAAFASGVLAARSHGLAADSPITFAISSISTLGAPDAALPGGLSVGVAYYARPLGSDLFQAATAVSPAAPIASFSTAGSGVFSFILDHGPYLDAAILFASRIFDEFARAHEGTIRAEIVPLVTSFLAGRIYTSAHRRLIPEQKAGEDAAPSWIRSIVDKLFALWLSGVDVKGAIDDTPSKADMGPVAVRLQGRGFLRGDREELV